MGRDLTASALLTTSLLGVCAAAAMLGVPPEHDAFVSMPFGSVASRYRWVTELLDLAEHLRAQGYDLSDADEDPLLAYVAVAT